MNTFLCHNKYTKHKNLIVNSLIPFLDTKYPQYKNCRPKLICLVEESNESHAGYYTKTNCIGINMNSITNRIIIFTKIFFHEYVHFIQYMRGDTFDNTLPYKQRPHEVEAFKLQEVLYNEFIQCALSSEVERRSLKSNVAVAESAGHTNLERKLL